MVRVLVEVVDDESLTQMLIAMAEKAEELGLEEGVGFNVFDIEEEVFH